MIDRWDGARLIRAAAFGQTWLPFAATATGGLDAPAFEVTLSNPRDEEVIKSAAATTFVPAPTDYGSRLLKEDSVLAGLDAQFPGIRQIRQLDLFTALVRCISAQQVNLRWAVTTRRRLAETFGRRYIVAGHPVYALDPEPIAKLDPAQIRALQFTNSKSASIVAVARAMLEPGLELHEIAQLEDDEVIARLIAIRGIGHWSADWVLARTLGRPRVVAGDLGVRKAVGLAYLGTPAPSEAEVRAATAHWRESAGVAQALLLHALGEGALLKPAPPVSRAASRP